MQKENTIINPCQPYVELGVDDVSRLDMPKLGISHFYEFFLGNKLLHELKAVPDGSIDLLFNIGKSRVTTFISGTVFGVKKWELSMDMLVNDDLEIDGNLFGKNLTERIAMATDIKSRSMIFMEAYRDFVYGRPDLSDKEMINEYLVNRITRANGHISINELQEETNYSACYLRRVFKNYNSISPKQFARYIRFQTLLDKLNTNNTRYDELALDCGYFDEAHMMKEFKSYAGLTLEQYRKMQRRI